ncbi:MAG: VWA domain-containing protein [Ignavibacteriae bacterium]|nr:VWA domain-containing protein [Ignavibacteria bacterium]MBI3365290.1 VWA domain-containing protein [Ignavibacteriota bacterium]
MAPLAALSISFGGNLVFAILLCIAFTMLAILFYRYTLPPIPRKRRIVLLFLRALALVLLLLILFEPLLRLINRNEQKPVVAVLLDVSQSMGMVDGAGNRADAIRRILVQKPLEKLPAAAATEYFLFSSQLSPPLSKPPDSIAFTGEVTNLSDALDGIKSRMTTDNIQAAVLISDGNYTAGKNPLYSAEALGVPLFTVGVGDTIEQKDVLIEKVTTNAVAYAETRVPVDVTVKSSGYAGENVEVRLLEGTTVLDHNVITLQSGTHEYSVRLAVEPKEEGTKRYAVDVSRLPGELTEKNNVRSFFMKVLKSKVRVVMFTGAPSPDVAAVQQALAEEEQFSVRSFVQRAPGELYGNAVTRSILDSADCFVFVGFPSAATSSSSFRQIAEVIAQQKKPLLYIDGKLVDFTKLQQIESILPFGWSAASQAEVEVFPSVGERQKNHPLVTFDGTFSAESWQKLPPIFKTQTSFRAKPESDVLAFVKIQNIVLTEPLVLTRSIARQKSFAVTGHGVWHWRLMAQGNNQTEQFFSLLMTNAVRWLTTNEDEKRVRIIPVKETFTTAEAVEFTGQVYDEQFRPTDNAEVIVTLEHGKEKIEMALTAVGNGRYEGSLSGVAEGDYTYSGKAGVNGTSLGEDKGRISVGQVNVEFLQTKMDKQLLEQIAYRTGGRYFNLNEAKDLANDIVATAKLIPKELVQASEIELWNWQYFAAFLIVIFALEWFLRKRSGML